MALSDLVAKILDEAKKEVVKIEADTADRIEAMEGENDQKIVDRNAETRKRTDEKKATMLKKIETLGLMQRRNSILQTKQDSIETVLNNIVESIVNLPDAEYQSIISILFEKSGKVEGAVFHPAKGKENQTISGMKKTKMAYKQGASRDIKGGFVLISDTIEIDNSIESIVKSELRKNIELEVSKILFV